MSVYLTEFITGNKVNPARRYESVLSVAPILLNLYPKLNRGAYTEKFLVIAACVAPAFLSIAPPFPYNNALVRFFFFRILSLLQPKIGSPFAVSRSTKRSKSTAIPCGTFYLKGVTAFRVSFRQPLFFRVDP